MLTNISWHFGQVSTTKMEKNKIEPKKESSSKTVQNGSLDQLLDLNDGT